MSFSIQKEYPSQSSINTFIGSYNSINYMSFSVAKSTDFVVDSNNSFSCSSSTGKQYVVLPVASGNKGRILVFVNVTENELISVDNLTSLNPVYNVFYVTLSPSILNSYSQYFAILVSNGSFWVKTN